VLCVEGLPRDENLVAETSPVMRVWVCTVLSISNVEYPARSPRVVVYLLYVFVFVYVTAGQMAVIGAAFFQSSDPSVPLDRRDHQCFLPLAEEGIVSPAPSSPA
jgi:hypothetical protein